MPKKKKDQKKIHVTTNQLQESSVSSIASSRLPITPDAKDQKITTPPAETDQKTALNPPIASLMHPSYLAPGLKIKEFKTAYKIVSYGKKYSIPIIIGIEVNSPDEKPSVNSTVYIRFLYPSLTSYVLYGKREDINLVVDLTKITESDKNKSSIINNSVPGLEAKGIFTKTEEQKVAKKINHVEILNRAIFLSGHWAHRLLNPDQLNFDALYDEFTQQQQAIKNECKSGEFSEHLEISVPYDRLKANKKIPGTIIIDNLLSKKSFAKMTNESYIFYCLATLMLDVSFHLKDEKTNKKAMEEAEYHTKIIHTLFDLPAYGCKDCKNCYRPHRIPSDAYMPFLAIIKSFKQFSGFSTDETQSLLEKIFSVLLATKPRTIPDGKGHEYEFPRTKEEKKKLLEASIILINKTEKIILPTNFFSLPIPYIKFIFDHSPALVIYLNQNNVSMLLRFLKSSHDEEKAFQQMKSIFDLKYLSPKLTRDENNKNLLRDLIETNTSENVFEKVFNLLIKTAETEKFDLNISALLLAAATVIKKKIVVMLLNRFNNLNLFLCVENDKKNILDYVFLYGWQDVTEMIIKQINSRYSPQIATDIILKSLHKVLSLNIYNRLHFLLSTATHPLRDNEASDNDICYYPGNGDYSYTSETGFYYLSTKANVEKIKQHAQQVIAHHPQLNKTTIFETKLSGQTLIQKTISDSEGLLVKFNNEYRSIKRSTRCEILKYLIHSAENKEEVELQNFWQNITGVSPFNDGRDAFLPNLGIKKISVLLKTLYYFNSKNMYFDISSALRCGDRSCPANMAACDDAVFAFVFGQDNQFLESIDYLQIATLVHNHMAPLVQAPNVSEDMLKWRKDITHFLMHNKLENFMSFHYFGNPIIYYRLFLYAQILKKFFMCLDEIIFFIINSTTLIFKFYTSSTQLIISESVAEEQKQLDINFSDNLKMFKSFLTTNGKLICTSEQWDFQPDIIDTETVDGLKDEIEKFIQQYQLQVQRTKDLIIYLDSVFSSLGLKFIFRDEKFTINPHSQLTVVSLDGTSIKPPADIIFSCFAESLMTAYPKIFSHDENEVIFFDLEELVLLNSHSDTAASLQSNFIGRLQDYHRQQTIKEVKRLNAPTSIFMHNKLAAEKRRKKQENYHSKREEDISPSDHSIATPLLRETKVVEIDKKLKRPTEHKTSIAGHDDHGQHAYEIYYYPTTRSSTHTVKIIDLDYCDSSILLGKFLVSLLAEKLPYNETQSLTSKILFYNAIYQYIRISQVIIRAMDLTNGNLRLPHQLIKDDCQFSLSLRHVRRALMHGGISGISQTNPVPYYLQMIPFFIKLSAALPRTTVEDSKDITYLLTEEQKGEISQGLSSANSDLTQEELQGAAQQLSQEKYKITKPSSLQHFVACLHTHLSDIKEIAAEYKEEQTISHQQPIVNALFCLIAACGELQSQQKKLNQTLEGAWAEIQLIPLLQQCLDLRHRMAHTYSTEKGNANPVQNGVILGLAKKLTVFAPLIKRSQPLTNAAENLENKNNVSYELTQSTQNA